MNQRIYDFEMPLNNGNMQSLADYKGKVLLIVNTASKCGFTYQYEGLQALHEQFKQQGLVVLGFPCDQFGHQEPGSDSQVQEFCSLNFGVSFPLFQKSMVNGDQASPLFKHLKSEAPGIFGTERIKWNFTKFLVDRSGKVVKRYGSNTKPETLASDIEKLL